MEQTLVNISAERADRVEKARQVWIGRLMDTSRRNNLLYFRDLKTGSLDISTAPPDAIRRLFDGEKVPVGSAVTSDVDSRTGARLREIARKAQSNLEEKGLQTLFVAFGMASWTIDDDQRPPEAAIVLLPIAVEGRRNDQNSMVMQAVGAPQANIALLHALAEEHGVVISEEVLLNAGVQQDDRFDPHAAVRFLEDSAGRIRGFSTKKRIVVGNFSFQKLAMVKDLRECSELLVSHDMVAALAGDGQARSALGGRRIAVEPDGLDHVPAEREFMVLDADSSQQAVVHSVAADLDGVIQGPPGCGKSQTIANVIATLVAHGKRVLFVAEKRAALEAVHKRLAAKELGHVALDLHGAGISQRSIMAKVAENLDRIRNSSEAEYDALHQKFEDLRGRLAAHNRMMHLPQVGSELTPFEMQAGILESAKVGVSKTRWRGAELVKLNKQAYAKVMELLAEASGVASLILRSDSSPWSSADLLTGEQVQSALDAAIRLSEEHLPKLMRTWSNLPPDSNLPIPTTLGEVEGILALFVETNEFLANWDTDIFGETGLEMALAPAKRGFLHRSWAALTSSMYRQAKGRAKRLCKRNSKNTVELLMGAQVSNSLVRRWASLGEPSTPQKVDCVDELSWALEPVAADMAVLQQVLPDLASHPLSELPARVAELASDDVTAHTIPTVRRIERGLTELGLGAFLLEMRSRSAPAEDWPHLFRHAYYASCYDAARSDNPSLAGFRGEVHSNFAEQFREFDRERIKIAARRVSRRHAEYAIEAMNSAPDQTLLIKQECKKRSRHIPLRKLVVQAGDVLTAVFPCWMSSPLNVSQLLPAERRYFDYVIFDEASQVLPEDAICSVLRGNRLVVAGDPNQLPPTSFFADGIVEEEEDAPTAGYESLLDQMSAFVDHWPLDWHYRSRDERLIAFSNRHIYGDRLVTFPGIGGQASIEHILVDSIPRDGEEDSSSAEVERVVGLILQHAEAQYRKPILERESLGVIAFGIRHANRVQAALDRALESHAHLTDFLDTAKDNAWFFLKNLERVQGDERDVILLTVGYGKDRSGRLPYRFGPLLREGGERRLNVAITRAMKRVILVSSFSHLDMDPGRSNRRGVELLRLYLQFAASEGANLGDFGATGESMNSFEADVHDALTQRGVPLLPQYGVSGFRLDFAALHPNRPGQFVLAIECDGASYHSSPTARDRDRLRQQQLEAIGWKFHRIWSTDWFLRRESEIERAVEAWRKSVRIVDDERVADEAPFQEGVGQSSVAVGSEVSGEVNIGHRAGSAPIVQSFSDLVELVRWITSDSLLRTDSEIIDEVLPLIGYRRRGARVVETILQAIQRSRSDT